MADSLLPRCAGGDVRCFECDAIGKVHAHHVVPRAKGGRRTVPLCEECHAKVHGLSSMGISHLVSIVKQEKKLRGEALGGLTPYGYRKVRRENDGVAILRPCVAEKEIMRRFLEIRGTGKSFRKIEKMLRSEAPTGTRLPSYQTIRRICQRAR